RRPPGAVPDAHVRAAFLAEPGGREPDDAGPGHDGRPWPAIDSLSEPLGHRTSPHLRVWTTHGCRKPIRAPYGPPAGGSRAETGVDRAQFNNCPVAPVTPW